MKRRTVLLIKLIISLTLIIGLLYIIGPKKVIDTILKINPWWFPIILILYFLTLFISSFNMYILLKPFSYKIKFSRIVKFTFLSWAAGVITPAKIGNFSMVYLLKKEGVDMGKGTAIFVLDKIISLSVNFIFLVLGFSLFLTLNQFLITLLAILGAAAIPSFFLFNEKGRFIIKKFILRGYSVKFSGFSKCIHEYIRKYKRFIIIDSIATLTSLVIASMYILVLFISFGQFTSLYNIIVIRSINTFASLIPITLDGLGVRESLAVLLFGQFGVSAPVVITSYLILMIMNYAFAGLVLPSLFEKKLIKKY